MSTPGCWMAQVVSAAPLTPSMMRVVLGGPDLADFTTLGAPDECVTLYFPREGEQQPPRMTEVGGRWGFHDVAEQPVGRNYTVRACDPAAGTVTIDFVLHEGGVASTWAARRPVGAHVLLAYQRSWWACPDDADWRLMLADLTGLPALARALEQMPADTRAHAVIEVPTPGDVVALDAPEHVTIDWLVGHGNGVSPGALLEAARVFTPPAGRGYVWFAAEAGASRGVRRHFRELGLGRDQMDVIGYWREDAERWLRRYEEVQAEVLAVYEAALASGKSDKEAGDEYDRALERLGL